MPELFGAVYSPLVEIVPPVADQVTAVLLVPVTVAENCWVPLVNIEAEVGEMVTATGALTVTVAEAEAEVLAVLLAVTV